MCHDMTDLSSRRGKGHGDQAQVHQGAHPPGLGHGLGEHRRPGGQPKHWYDHRHPLVYPYDANILFLLLCLFDRTASFWPFVR